MVYITYTTCNVSQTLCMFRYIEPLALQGGTHVACGGVGSQCMGTGLVHTVTDGPMEAELHVYLGYVLASWQKVRGYVSHDIVALSC